MITLIIKSLSDEWEMGGEWPTIQYTSQQLKLFLQNTHKRIVYIHSFNEINHNNSITSQFSPTHTTITTYYNNTKVPI